MSDSFLNAPDAQAPDEASGDPVRQYPAGPVVAVSGVVLLGLGSVLLVKRRHPPLRDAWSLPGGVLKLGETLEDGVRREIQEETGLQVTVGPLVEVVEHIERAPTGRVAYHYVIVDYVCRALGAGPVAGGDAQVVACVDAARLGAYGLSDATETIIRRASELGRRLGW